VGLLAVDVEHLVELRLERLERVAAVLRGGVNGVDGDAGHAFSSVVVRTVVFVVTRDAPGLLPSRPQKCHLADTLAWQ